MGRTRSSEQGFTLIEVMIVVAIVAVLAVIVVPMWTKEARKGKADPEVRAMFTEIALKEEQYKAETGNGGYLDLAACPATSASGVDMTAQTCFTSGGWSAVHTLPTEKNIRCSYALTSHAAGTAPTGMPSWVSLPANLSSSVIAWYFVVATCDMDNDSSTTNATFFTASWDTSMQKDANYGQ